MTDRAEGAERVHATIEAVMRAEQACSGAVTWFWPIGSMADETRQVLQDRHDRLERVKKQLADTRKDLATLMGEVYRDVVP